MTPNIPITALFGNSPFEENDYNEKEDNDKSKDHKEENNTQEKDHNKIESKRIDGHNRSGISSGIRQAGGDSRRHKSRTDTKTASRMFNGIGSRIIRGNVILRNEGDNPLVGCKTSYDAEGNKVYVPDGGKPMKVWSKQTCTTRLEDAFKLGKIKDLLMASANWLADAADGWDTRYRSDCVKQLHDVYDELGYQQKIEEKQNEPKRIQLFKKRGGINLFKKS